MTVAQAEFEAVLAEAKLQVGDLVSVEVGESTICVARTEQGVSAFDNACPHRQQPLSEGTLEHNVLTCAGHTWQFDANTGALLDLRAPLCLAMREVRVRNGMIEVAK